MSGERQGRVETIRRYLVSRQEALLARIPEMSDEELRWTVRLFTDCLDEASRALYLQSYSEYLPLGRLREAVAAFVPEYTKLALLDLEAKSAVEGDSLGALTDEELQSISCAEKWRLLQANPGALAPLQLRRELARLLFCKTLDLYFDPSLPIAAIEFPRYFEAQETLAALPGETLEKLKRDVLERLGELEQGPYLERERTLQDMRAMIAEAIGLEGSLETLFEGRMERLPREGQALPEEPPSLYLEDMSLDDLRMSVKVLADLMSLEESREVLLPLREQYPSFSDIPAEELKKLIRRLAWKLGNRTVLDYTGRYRFGKLLTQRSPSPEVWALLPEEEKLKLLLEDSDRMDIAQTARHISRVFMCSRYDMLSDIGAQLSILDEPLYQALQNRLIFEWGKSPHEDRLLELNRAVTRMMWEVEKAHPSDRERLLLEARKVIGAALSLPDTLLGGGQGQTG